MSVAARTVLEASLPKAEKRQWGALFVKLLTTTDHKLLGNMYFVTSLVYFGIAGFMALVIRAELAFPGKLFVGRI